MDDLPQVGARVKILSALGEEPRIARVLKLVPEFEYVVCRFRGKILVQERKHCRWKQKNVIRRGMFKRFGDVWELMKIDRTK